MSKSGVHCSVYGCTYNWKKLKEILNQSCFQHFPTKRSHCSCEAPFAFFKMPTQEDLKQQWLTALRRKTPPKTVYVCSFHFTDRKPTEENPVPQLFMGYEKVVKKRKVVRSTTCTTNDDVPSSSSQKSTSSLLTSSLLTSSLLTSSSTSATSSSSSTVSDTHSVVRRKRKAAHSNTPVPEKQSKDATNPSSEDSSYIEDNNPDTNCNFIPTVPSTVDACTQWIDPSLESHNYTKNVLHIKKHRAIGLQTISPSQMNANIQCSINKDEGVAVTMIKTNSDSYLYTGVSHQAFWDLVSALSTYASKSFCMPVADQILMTMMKLKLNLLLSDLGKRFCVSHSLVSKTNSFWMDVMADHLNEFVVWLPSEIIHSTMPSCFKSSHPETICILDCAEIFTQKPKKLKSPGGETYSNYKSHNILKYLVAFAPSGLIMFISHAFEGRASDEFIVENSGLLNCLLPGDEVMADRGFTISDVLLPMHVKLNISTFTRGKQPSKDDVTSTRQLDNAQKHVKRTIKQIKMFKILKDTVPITLTSKIDKVLKICAALVNIRGNLNRGRV